MKKTYEEQMKDIRVKEMESAKKHGFETVEEWREHQAVQNRVKTYKVKVQSYEQQIAEMQKKLAEMQKYIAENE